MHIQHISLYLKRFFAFLVDLLLYSVIFTVVYIKLIFPLLDPFEDSIYPITLLLYFFLFQFYCIIVEYFGRGASPGKNLLKIKVVSIDSAQLSFAQIILRNLSKVILFIPPLFLMNEVYLYIAFRKKFSDFISNSEIAGVRKKLKINFSNKEKKLIDVELQQQLELSLHLDEINLLKKFHAGSKYLTEDFKNNFFTQFLGRVSERIFLSSNEITKINPHILFANILYKIKNV